MGSACREVEVMPGKLFGTSRRTPQFRAPYALSSLLASLGQDLVMTATNARSVEMFVSLAFAGLPIEGVEK